MEKRHLFSCFLIKSMQKKILPSVQAQSPPIQIQEPCLHVLFYQVNHSLLISHVCCKKKIATIIPYSAMVPS